MRGHIMLRLVVVVVVKRQSRTRHEKAPVYVVTCLEAQIVGRSASTDMGRTQLQDMHATRHEISIASDQAVPKK